MEREKPITNLIHDVMVGLCNTAVWSSNLECLSKVRELRQNLVLDAIQGSEHQSQTSKQHSLLFVCACAWSSRLGSSYLRSLLEYGCEGHVRRHPQLIPHKPLQCLGARPFG